MFKLQTNSIKFINVQPNTPSKHMQGEKQQKNNVIGNFKKIY